MLWNSIPITVDYKLTLILTDADNHANATANKYITKHYIWMLQRKQEAENSIICRSIAIKSFLNISSLFRLHSDCTE